MELPTLPKELSPDALAADERLDRFVERVDRVAERVLANPSWRRALRGEWLGHPLHPALTDLPIGFWTTSFLLDFGGNRSRRAADSMVALGLLSALPTAAAGLADWQERDLPDRRLGVVHAAANTVATVLYAGSLGHRLRGNRIRGIGFGLLAASAATAGAYLGGHLAFGGTSGASEQGTVASDPASSAGTVDQQGAALAAMSQPA